MSAKTSEQKEKDVKAFEAETSKVLGQPFPAPEPKKVEVVKKLTPKKEK